MDGAESDKLFKILWVLCKASNQVNQSQLCSIKFEKWQLTVADKDELKIANMGNRYTSVTKLAKLGDKKCTPIFLCDYF